MTGKSLQSLDLRVFESLSENSPLLLSYVGQDHRYQHVSRSYNALFGDRARAGAHVSDVVGEHTYKTLKPMLDAALAGRAQRVEVTVQLPVGRRSFVTHYTPDVTPSGSVLGVIVVAVDVTAQEELREELRRHADALSSLVRVGEVIAGELDLQALVQEVTDAATRMTGAEFGAFFYNVIERGGESYTLYTLSGVPRDAFAQFPMPRNTPIFEPTFRGTGILRLDDVKADPRYGRNAPHNGMPEGHLPVTSYLAVPVISRSGEVLGGLFFGHSQRAQFTARHEELVLALAAQAAVAIDNSRLFTELERRRQESEDAARESRYIADATKLLTSGFDADRMLQQIADRTAQHYHGLCVIDLLDGPTARRVAVAHGRDGGADLIRELRATVPTLDRSTLSHQVLSTGAGVRRAAPDMPAGTRGARSWEIVRALDLSEVMVVPLALADEKFGVIIVGAPESRRLDDRDLETLSEVASRTAIMLANARLYREANRASQAKDHFLATLSHELRTPLNATLGWISLLQTGNLGEAQRARALDVIERNVRAQAQLVQDMLDVSAIVTGKLTLRREAVDVSAVVKAAMDVVRPIASDKQIVLECDLPASAATVEGDPVRLQQVVWNLLANAVKFTPREGRILVRVSASDEVIALDVIDNGAGIPPDFLPHVFERFRQAEASGMSERSGGLGLGLALVRQIVEMHQGYVSAASEGPGKGATFHVVLPVASPRP